MSSAPLLPLLITFAFGYLLGSIPTGLLLTRAAGLGDVRKIGSGNIGATNVLRTGSKKIAALTLFLDGFKGYLAVALTGMLLAPMLMPANEPVLIGGSAGSAQSAAAIAGSLQASVGYFWRFLMAAGLGAFLGHLYPVWLGFKGGKGVATYIGVLLGLAVKAGLVFCGIWLVVAYFTRYSSLSSLVASALTPVLLYFFGLPQLAILALLITGLVFFKHSENISRLLKGTESKIGEHSAQKEVA